MDWTKFLSGIPADDYVFQNIPYDEQIKTAQDFIIKADCILIGAGAGISTAAGLTYSGKRFQDNFSEFIKKYGVTDMYSAGFYPFSTEEERWGYWSKHSYINRIEPDAMSLYIHLFEMVKNKNYFVLTTNVDHQFQKAGFDENRIFATQGDYGLMQCANGCHNKTYDAVPIFTQMNNERKDCKIPTYLVPKCPVCGGKMTMNLRCDDYFVEDEKWNKAAENYGKYLENNMNKNILLLELGVGFNTPIIIRFPFERMVKQNNNIKMIRLNLNEAVIPQSFGDRAVGINEDISKSIDDIRKGLILA